MSKTPSIQTQALGIIDMLMLKVRGADAVQHGIDPNRLNMSSLLRESTLDKLNAGRIALTDEPLKAKGLAAFIIETAAQSAQHYETKAELSREGLIKWENPMASIAHDHVMNTILAVNLAIESYQKGEAMPNLEPKAVEAKVIQIKPSSGVSPRVIRPKT